MFNNSHKWYRCTTYGYSYHICFTFNNFLCGYIDNLYHKFKKKDSTGNNTYIFSIYCRMKSIEGNHPSERLPSYAIFLDRIILQEPVLSTP